ARGWDGRTCWRTATRLRSSIADRILTERTFGDRTYVPMIACILIPGFELRAALRERPRLATRAAALAPLPGADPLVGPLTAAAEVAGVRPGMRLGEALAMCPSLELVEQDPAEAGLAWEGIVRRLEDEGFAIEPAGMGCLYFE